jgi:hypothetical protein
MYPDGELRRLASDKASIRRGIALRRAECAEAAALVARPLEWLDRALAFWRRFSPLAKLAIVPLGLLVRRRFLRRHKLLGALARWGPLAASVLRGFDAASKVSPGSNGEK